MSGRTYRVACLAGNGVGPELMAEASRALVEVARFHGFEVEERHVPFGSEALSRSGHPLPLATRAAYLQADAVLVAIAGEPALDDVESELDLRASATRVAFGPGCEVTLLSPLADDLAGWTVDRAFEVACAGRARLASVGADGRWRELVDAVAGRYDGVEVEHLTVSAGMPALAFEPERFDVVVTGPLFGDALATVLASIEREARVVARGRLAGNAPGVFSPGHEGAPDIAGQGVADPSSMLLATALMLGEGLGERAAAATLAGAVTGTRRGRAPALDSVLAGVTSATRHFTDAVLSELQVAITNAEFRDARR